MTEPALDPLVSLETEHPIWDRVLSVAPLVVVGTREEDGRPDLAPKHMAAPMGWRNYFGFVCTPTHATYANIRRDGVFTVSFPRPDQVVLASLAASPRCEDGSKASLDALPTIPAREVDGVLLENAYFYLECRLDRIIDGFGPNSLISGEIVAAHAHRQALLGADRDPQDVLAAVPLLVYINPGRFAEIRESRSFPLPEGFRR